jgi:hypothetical protein
MIRFILASTEHMANSEQHAMIHSAKKTNVFDWTYTFPRQGQPGDKGPHTHAVKVKVFLLSPQQYGPVTDVITTLPADSVTQPTDTQSIPHH